MSVYSTCVSCNSQTICNGNGICLTCECNNQTFKNVVDDGFDVNTEYFLPSEFNLMKKQYNSNSLMTCIHFNCRSLKSNYDHLISCINSLELGHSIIGVSETWLQEKEDITCPVPHYNFVGRGRSEKRGGGVGIFLHEHFKFKRRSVLEVHVFNENIESVFTEILNPHNNII